MHKNMERMETSIAIKIFKKGNKNSFHKITWGKSS